jgi:hypothetical protein
MSNSRTSYAEIIKKPVSPSVLEKKTVKNETPEKLKETGSEIKLADKWVFWSHSLENRNWKLDSYKKLYTISTVSEFWKVFNNLESLGVNVSHTFFMREGINPTWEDPANRNGGVCSFKIEIGKLNSATVDFGSYLVKEMLTDTENDINGISISPKNSWGILKLWNKDAKNDISKCLNPELLEKYKSLSIKYSVINPED